MINELCNVPSCDQDTPKRVAVRAERGSPPVIAIHDDGTKETHTAALELDSILGLIQALLAALIWWRNPPQETGQ